MCRSNIIGNRQKGDDEINAKTALYHIRQSSKPIIKKVNHQPEEIEKIYKNKTGKPIHYLDHELATRPSQLSDYNFTELRNDIPKVNDSNTQYMHMGNARKNKLIEKDREIEPIQPKNTITRTHRDADFISTDPTLGLNKVKPKNNLSKARLLDGNRESYMPQQPVPVQQNKVYFKVMS